MSMEKKFLPRVKIDTSYFNVVSGSMAVIIDSELMEKDEKKDTYLSLQEHESILAAHKEAIKIAMDVLNLISGPSEFNCAIGEANQRAAAIEAKQKIEAILTKENCNE